MAMLVITRGCLFFFSHPPNYWGICHLRLKEGITIYHPQKHPLQHEKISVYIDHKSQGSGFLNGYTWFRQSISKVCLMSNMDQAKRQRWYQPFKPALKK